MHFQSYAFHDKHKLLCQLCVCIYVFCLFHCFACDVYFLFFSFQMAYELHGMLTGAVSSTTWEKVLPAYGGQPESFLNNVVTPIYRVIYEVILMLVCSCCSQSSI